MKNLILVLKNLLSVLFWFMLMSAFSNKSIAVQTILAAVLHECGHIFMLLLLKKKFSLPCLVTSGMRIKTHSNLSYKEEIAVCAAGPLINVFLFLFFLPYSAEFSLINLATAISNLLPLSGYDGYNVINDSISLFYGHENAGKTMPKITLGVSAAAVFLSLFLILKLNGGYWIFFVFFFVFMREILVFQKDTKSEYK